MHMRRGLAVDLGAYTNRTCRPCSSIARLGPGAKLGLDAVYDVEDDLAFLGRQGVVDELTAGRVATPHPQRHLGRDAIGGPGVRLWR